MGCSKPVTSPSYQLSEDGVRHIPGDVAERLCGRVGEDDRSPGDGQHVSDRLQTGVTEVHQHPQPVHLTDHLLAGTQRG